MGVLQCRQECDKSLRSGFFFKKIFKMETVKDIKDGMWPKIVPVGWKVNEYNIMKAGSKWKAICRVSLLDECDD